jgi:hypothetical protein
MLVRRQNVVQAQLLLRVERQPDALSERTSFIAESVK